MEMFFKNFLVVLASVVLLRVQSASAAQCDNTHLPEEPTYLDLYPELKTDELRALTSELYIDEFLASLNRAELIITKSRILKTEIYLSQRELANLLNVSISKIGALKSNLEHRLERWRQIHVYGEAFMATLTPVEQFVFINVVVPMERSGYWTIRKHPTLKIQARRLSMELRSLIDSPVSLNVFHREISMKFNQFMRREQMRPARERRGIFDEPK